MLPVPLPILWGLYWAHLLKLESSSSSLSLAFSALKQFLGNYFSFRSLFNFRLWTAGTAKSNIQQVLFFLFFFFFWFTITRSGSLTEIRWSVCVPEIFVRLIFWDEFWIVHIPYVCLVKFKRLAQFPVDQLPHPVVSCLMLFCDNLLHSFIMGLIVSLLHNLLFCCFLSVLAMT